jgi:serine/threonine protein kinase
MYSNSLIRAPSASSESGSDDFQNLFNQPLNHRYRLLKRLGQGGFGQTFLAVDEQNQSLPCVVKQLFLRQNATNQPTTSERFYEEVKRLAELDEHPKIPKLIDTFEQNDSAFIVQDWIDGWTLAEEAADIPFDEAEIWQVLRDILPVLQYLHDRNIIHRDIKPANIIRRRSDRQLVLIDFGAAKQITPLNSCHTGTMIGSVEYAAPEQVKGQATFASDLYSLGVTCLYLLTQIPPFDLYDIVEDEWKWQTYLPQPISAALQSILCKLLQPAIRRRYQSAAEVLVELQTSSVLTTKPQRDEAIVDESFCLKRLFADTNDSLTLKSIDDFVQKTPSVSGATIYLPLTQDWYYLPSSESISDSKPKTGFFLSPPVAGIMEVPLQDEPLFAEEIAAIKTLPLVQRVLVMSLGAIVGMVAMACLVFCLGTILFALIVPPQSSTAPMQEKQSAINSF